MFDIIPNTLSLLLTTLLPLYATHKSLSTSSPSLLAPWLTYYALASLIPAVELILPLITYLPLYAWLRLFAHLYLLLPGESQGAGYIYAVHLAPWLRQHERTIENGIADVHDKAVAFGWDHVKQLIRFVRESLLGMKPEERQMQKDVGKHPAVVPSAANSYVSNLLARFSAPATQAQTPGVQAQGSTTNDVYAMLTGAFAQATSASGTSGFGGTSSATARGVGATDKPEDRLREIRTQRERLTLLLGEYEAEEGRLKGLNINLAGTGDGRTKADMKKSRSETDFERIDSADVGNVAGNEDAGSGARPGPVESGKDAKKGWGEWLFGGGKAGTGVKDKDA